ncbi:MAG: CoA transferase [Chloroflexi bacterium]|nr:CoA transferase [Chloroflexota bacterium]
MVKRQALAGVRVVSVEQVLQLPWATMVLADMGAEVIRVESLSRIQSRESRPYPEDQPGEKWWNQSGHYSFFFRNKKSLTLDLRQPKGQELFRELVKTADVVVENNRSGVMKRLGLDYETLRRVKQDIIMLSSTGYGQTGPWRTMGAFGRTVHPISGMCNCTGYDGGQPERFEDNTADICTGWNNALAILIALHHRRRTGEGMYIDMSMYETNANHIAVELLGVQMRSSPHGRLGNAHQAMVPHGCYRCAGDDDWVTLSVRDDGEWQALTEAMGRPELASDQRFADPITRWRNRHELDEIIELWTRGQDKRELMHQLQEAGVPAGAVMRAPDLLTDPHLKARGYFEWFAHPPEWERVGSRPFQGRPYRFSKTPGAIRFVAGLGEHNQEVLGGELGLSPQEMAELERQKVIGTTPAAEREGPYQRDLAGAPTPMGQRLVTDGTLTKIEPDYRKVLGLDKVRAGAHKGG